MGWIIHKDTNITIKGTSNGYFTIIVQGDTEEPKVYLDVDSPIYLYNLAKAFEDAAKAMENLQEG